MDDKFNRRQRSKKSEQFNRREHDKRDRRLRALGLRGEPYRGDHCLHCQIPLPEGGLLCIACEGD